MSRTRNNTQLSIYTAD